MNLDFELFREKVFLVKSAEEKQQWVGYLFDFHGVIELDKLDGLAIGVCDDSLSRPCSPRHLLREINLLIVYLDL